MPRCGSDVGQGPAGSHALKVADLDVLYELRNGASLSPFASREKDVFRLSEALCVCPGCAVRALFDVQFVQLLSASLARGLQLCQGAYEQQDQRSIVAVAGVADILRCCCAGAHAGWLATNKDSTVPRLQMASEVAKSGLLPAFNGACLALAVDLKRQHQAQQQQQQQQGQREQQQQPMAATPVNMLSLALLRLWLALSDIWPGRLLSGKALATTVVPVCTLAVAALHAWSAPVSTSSSIGTGSNSRDSSSASSTDSASWMYRRPPYDLSPLRCIMFVPCSLLQAVLNEMADELQPEQEVVQLLGHDHVQLLLLLSLAVAAQALHQRQHEVRAAAAAAVAAGRSVTATAALLSAMAAAGPVAFSATDQLLAALGLSALDARLLADVTYSNTSIAELSHIAPSIAGALGSLWFSLVRPGGAESGAEQDSAAAEGAAVAQGSSSRDSSTSSSNATAEAARHTSSGGSGCWTWCCFRDPPHMQHLQQQQQPVSVLDATSGGELCLPLLLVLLQLVLLLPEPVFVQQCVHQIQVRYSQWVLLHRLEAPAAVQAAVTARRAVPGAAAGGATAAGTASAADQGAAGIAAAAAAADGDEAAARTAAVKPCRCTLCTAMQDFAGHVLQLLAPAVLRAVQQFREAEAAGSEQQQADKQMPPQDLLLYHLLYLLEELEDSVSSVYLSPAYLQHFSSSSPAVEAALRLAAVMPAGVGADEYLHYWHRHMVTVCHPRAMQQQWQQTVAAAADPVAMVLQMFSLQLSFQKCIARVQDEATADAVANGPLTAAFIGVIAGKGSAHACAVDTSGSASSSVHTTAAGGSEGNGSGSSSSNSKSVAVAVDAATAAAAPLSAVLVARALILVGTGLVRHSGQQEHLQQLLEEWQAWVQQQYTGEETQAPECEFETPPISRIVEWLGCQLQLLEVPGGAGDALQHELCRLLAEVQHLADRMDHIDHEMKAAADKALKDDAAAGTMAGSALSGAAAGAGQQHQDSTTEQFKARLDELLQEFHSFVQQLGQQLQQLGAAVCAQLPLPHCCNHPGCVNLAQLSELQLVGGKSCICGGCRVARYCSKDCQLAHWKQHKPVCRRLKAQQQQP